MGDLTPIELLGKYWQASHTPEEDVAALQELATVILQEEGEEEVEEVTDAEDEEGVEAEALGGAG